MTFEFSTAGDAIRLQFDAMASRNEIVIAGMDPAAARAALQAAAAEVSRIEAKYSRYRAGSVVSRINASAGSECAVVVDPETAGLLDFSGRLFELSDGLFDITSGALRHAWDFRAARVPSNVELAPLLALVDWRQVEWDGRQVRLTRAGMELDFGGIGKEYATDRAHAVLLGAGVQHGFVNLAGDLRVLGPRLDATPWVFGIQHPRDPGATCAQVQLSQGALATSGDYERFFTAPDGRRCCHILDPRTGQPVSHWQSISVIVPACAAAGALATIGMLRGPGAEAFLREQGAAFLAVDHLGRVHSHDVDFPLSDSRSMS
jgi:thiamine biosynthesis lipoprotein